MTMKNLLVSNNNFIDFYLCMFTVVKNKTPTRFSRVFFLVVLKLTFGIIQFFRDC